MARGRKRALVAWAVASLIALASVSFSPSPAAGAGGTVVEFSGRVLTADDLPVPGLHITVNSSASSATVTTDETGAFSLSAVDGANTIRLEWQNTDPLITGPLELPKAFEIRGTTTFAGDRTQDLTLPPTVTITAHVNDSRGDPIEGARVEGFDHETITGPVTLPDITTTFTDTVPGIAYTDATGTAQVHTFPATVGLLATSTLGGTTLFDQIDDLDATTDTTADLTLPAIVEFSGRVLTADDLPVPGLHITVNSSASSATVTTDETGAFSLSAVDGANTIRLEWQNTDPLITGPLELPKAFEIRGTTTFAGDRTQDLTLPPTVTITAHVNDSRGDPIEGARVEGFDHETITGPVTLPDITTTFTDTVPGIAYTDATGTAQVHTFPATVGLLATSTLGGTTLFDQIDDLDATTDTTADLTLPAIVEFSGRVLTADDLPVPGLHITVNSSASSATVTTDETGAFSLSAVDGANTIRLEWQNTDPLITGPLELPKAFEIRGTTTFAGDRTQDLTLPPTVTITAHVNDSRGDPIEGARVEGFDHETITGPVTLPDITTTFTDTVPGIAYTDATGTAQVHTFPATVGLLATSTLGGTTLFDQIDDLDATTDTTADLTLPARPTAPESLDAVPGDGTVLLTWTPPADDGDGPLTSYEVIATPEAPVSGVHGARQPTAAATVVVVPPTVTTTRLRQLANGTNYRIEVRAKNEFGGGVAASLRTTPRTVPGAPVNLVATPGNQSVSLAWNAPTSDGGAAITAYRVYRDDVLIRTTPNRTITDSGRTNGVAVTYRVSAVNPAGTGRLTTVRATPRTVPGPPTSVVAAPSNQRVTLTWNAPTNNGGAPITAYRIYRDDVLIRTTPNRTYTDSGRTNGVAITYRIAAVNAAGPGRLTTIRATPRTVPGAPTNVVAAPSNQRVALTWNAPTNNGGAPITAYRIYRDDVLIRTTPNRTYTDSGRTNGVAITYRIAAVNAAGPGRLSTAVSATPHR